MSKDVIDDVINSVLIGGCISIAIIVCGLWGLASYTDTKREERARNIDKVFQQKGIPVTNTTLKCIDGKGYAVLQARKDTEGNWRERWSGNIVVPTNLSCVSTEESDK